MSRLALALLILAATPAAASAAPFGELSPLTVKNPARCLRATGAPGEVVRRAPGGADFAQATASGFSAPVHVALGDGFGDCPLAMAQPSGAAIVVEQTYDGIAFAVRDPAGAWTRADDRRGRRARSASAADGRPVFTWAPARTLDRLTWTAAAVATFPGGVQALSGPLRDADSVTPVILADGRPAIAWSDVSTGGDYRLHLAIEGAAAAPEPSAPAVEIGRVVQIPHGLAIPFRCSAACTVARRSVTAKLRVPRLPHSLGLKAIRRGKQIVVSWHTDRPLRNASIIAVSSDDNAFEDPFFGSTVEGEGRKRFRMNVDPILGKRYIQLFLFYAPAATERRIAVVRVTKGSSSTA